jgi:hypothetical protein
MSALKGILYEETDATMHSSISVFSSYIFLLQAQIETA